MNIDKELAKIDALLEQGKNIRDRIELAAQNTKNILDACEALGVKRIGISERNEKLKDSKHHPFAYSGSIFVDGQKDGWPMAWAVARMSGFSSGCGNFGQHQVSGSFLDGVYVCKNGVWRKE